MRESFPTFSVVGATGAVGREALSILAARGTPACDVRAFASERSAGTRLAFGKHSIAIERFEVEAAANADFTFLCAGATLSRACARDLVDAGTTVIDNSSAFRMVAGVPLVIPEVNGRDLDASERLIANPNCSTIILLTALTPLRRALGVRDIVVSTYQAVSGAGQRGIDELRIQTTAALARRSPAPSVFPESCAFNVFPHESTVDSDTGLNGEEQKMIDETRKIWSAPDLPMAPTCVRVPVVRAHSQSVTITLQCSSEPLVARAFLRGAPGVRLIENEPDHSITPRRAAGTDDVFVGRVRFDPESGFRRLSLWLCADQLRKGAALNALQIVDLLHTKRREELRRLLL